MTPHNSYPHCLACAEKMAPDQRSLSSVRPSKSEALLEAFVNQYHKRPAKEARRLLRAILGACLRHRTARRLYGDSEVATFYFREYQRVKADWVSYTEAHP